MEGLDCYLEIVDHMKIWSVGINNSVLRPSCVGTTVGMHHLDSNKTNEEKAWRELHKNKCYFKHIPGTAPHKTSRFTATNLLSHKPFKYDEQDK